MSIYLIILNGYTQPLCAFFAPKVEIQTDDPDDPIPVIGTPIEGGPGSKPVLGPDQKKIFITTPVGGLQPIDVNIPGLKVKMNSWSDEGS